MAALSNDFTNQSVLIYDAYDNHLGSTVINNYERDAKQIQINVMPESLKVNDNCKLLILTSPVPCEFMGRVKRVGGSLFIAMFQGQEKENRAAARYKVNTPAYIDAIIVDGQLHTLQTPVNVILINISTGGVRFRAPYYSFDKDDELQIHLIISNNRKIMTAKVVNLHDNGTASSDYSCQFT